MTDKFIRCLECKHEDRSPMTAFIVTVLDNGAEAVCPECKGKAVVTDGTDEAKQAFIEQTLVVEELPSVKTEQPPKGDTVRLSASVKYVVEWTQENFTGFKLIREDGHAQWNEFKHQLYNDPEFRKKIFLMNVFAEEAEMELLEMTPVMEIIEDE